MQTRQTPSLTDSGCGIGTTPKGEPQEWTVLAIPAICEQEYDSGLSERHIGDALWPSRHSIEKLQKQKARAPREFNALYQQHPTIEGGNIVKRDWFRTISLAEFRSLRFNEPIHFYLDTAYNKKKKGQDNDPSGVLAACRIRNYIYLIDAQKVYKEMPDLLRFLPQYIAAHDGNSDKEVRLRAVSPRVECGRVFIVEGSWNDDFLDEVCGFPSQPHDEFVDILGYAINDLYDEDDDIDYDILSKSSLGM